MFDIANLSLGVIILILRIAVVFLLYFFLWQVLQKVMIDVRVGSMPKAEPKSPYGQLLVIKSGQSGPHVGTAFDLKPVTIIGRSPKADIALPNDDFLSNEHARLELHDTEWVLEDMDSTNSTFINGIEVRNTTSIKAGDVIRLGRVELQLVR